MQFSTLPDWWTTDTYDIDATKLPGGFAVATVAVNPNGSTQPGWGLQGKDGGPGFMENFRKGRFNERVTTYKYEHRGDPFAYVMRSVPYVCIDVDGKNGGWASMPQLGHLPPTLAETSKSGNGLHLFYATGETWDEVEGYALYDDVIGIATGIDIRAVGCVYHHSTQRWNGRSIAPLPDFLATRLREKKEKRDARKAAIAEIKEMDMDDILVAQHELVTELEKPIPTGKRNNTLFAIGSKMKDAGVPGWDDKVLARAVDVGLDADEAEKLVANIAAYGS